MRRFRRLAVWVVEFMMVRDKWRWERPDTEYRHWLCLKLCFMVSCPADRWSVSRTDQDKAGENNVVETYPVLSPASGHQGHEIRRGSGFRVLRRRPTSELWPTIQAIVQPTFFAFWICMLSTNINISPSWHISPPQWTVNVVHVTCRKQCTHYTMT